MADPLDAAVDSVLGGSADAAVDTTIAKDDERQQLRQSLYGALKLNPDEYAKAKTFGGAIGVPAEVAHRNLPDVTSRAKLDDLDRALDALPGLAGQMRNIEFAKVAHDDVQSLGGLESVLQVFKRGARSLAAGLPSLAAGGYGIGEAAFDLASQAVGQPLGRAGILPADPFGMTAELFRELRKNQQRFSERVQGPLDGAGFVERSVYSGLQSVSQNLPGLAAGVVTGNPALPLAIMGGATAGGEYGKARDKGLTPVSAAAYAGAQGAVEIATEKLPINLLLKDLQAGAGFGATVLRQMAAEIPGEQAATLFQDLNEQVALNPDKTFGEYLAERPSAALQTLISTVTAVGVQTGAVKAIDALANRAAGAEQDAQALQQVVALAGESRLRERDPAAFKAFVAGLTKDGPVSDLYVDAQTFAQSLQQSGVDLAQLTQVMPGVRAELEDALAGNGDVRIPVEDFATHIAGSDLGNALLPHLRPDPDALSQAEAQSFMQEQAEQFKAAADKAVAEQEFGDAFKESAATVEGELLKQLQGANRFTSDVNSAYAKMMASFYTVQAARLGITPEEMYVRYPVQVRAEGADGGRTMEQAPGFEAVAYHGSNTPGLTTISANPATRQFDNASSVFGAFTSVSKDEAARYGSNIYPVKVSLRNPKRMSAGEFYRRYQKPEVDRDGNSTFATPGGLEARAAELKQEALADKEQWIDEGYDGLVVERRDGTAIEIASFADLTVDPIAALTPEQREVFDSIPRSMQGSLSPEQVDIENRFAAKLAADFEAVVAEYEAHPETAGGKILNTDIARELSPDYLADRTQSAAVHEPASWFIKQLYARKLAEAPKPGELPTVLFTAGGTGAGKSTGLSAVPRLAELSASAQIIYDTNMNGYTSAVRKIEQALDAGKRIEIVHVSRDPVDALVNGALPRAERQRSQFGTGRTVPLGEHAATHRDSGTTVQKIAAETRDNPDVSVSYVDNSRGFGNVAEVDALPAFDYNDIEAKLYAALEAEYQAGRVSEDTYRGFAGSGAAAVPAGDAGEARSFSQGNRQGTRGQPKPRRLSRAERVVPPLAQGQQITVGEPFVAVRYDTEASLDDRNAMTPEALLGFLTDLDDPTVATTALRKDDQALHFFAATANTPPGAYEPLNGRQSAGSRTVGARPRDGGLWLSFPKGGAWEARPLVSVTAAELKADLEARVGELWKADNAETVAALSAVLADRVDGENYAQGARGQITFRGDLSEPSVISLFESADLSTFLHESGHFYLEVLTDIARQPDAPAEVVADMGALLQWFGVPDFATWQGMSLEERRPHHEKLARGFEAYLFEGNAPSIELQSLFGRFRAWLVNVYRQLLALQVELTPEVRGVFARMLATNEQIVAAEQARTMQPLFETGEQAGMTPDEWAQYQAIGRDATQSAVDNLQRRSLRDMQWLTNAKGRALRRLQRETAAKRKAVRAEVVAEVMAEPVNLVRGFTARAGQRLSSVALAESFGGEGAWRGLPKNLVARDGLLPEMVAEMFGFDSADAMVQTLLTEPAAEEKIEAVTDQRMLERFGDLTSPDAMHRAAEAAVHNEARGRFVAAELQALEAAGQVREDTGRTVTDSRGRTRRLTTDAMTRAAKAFAAATVARRRIRDIRPSQYASAATRAAKAAETALKGGKLADAAAQKRNQLIGHYGARAAHDALAEVEKAVAYLRRFDEDGTRKSIDPDYVDQVDKLLERFDLRRVSNKAADKRASLLAWAESQREQGIEPIIDEALLDEARRTPYRELTLEEFRGVVDAVRNIEHLGRLKRKLLTARDQREFAERVAEAEASIRDNAKGSKPLRLESNQWRDRIRKGFDEFFAWHRKLASLFREMDGVKDNGALWDLFVRPMNEAGDREATMREQATVALSKLFTKDIRRGLRRKMFIPAINASLSKEGRLAIALNWGNETNRQRVLDGEGWTPAQAQAVLDTLSAVEWDFVQQVWSYVGSFWPEIAAKERRVTGLTPEQVEAAEVQTKFGTLPGGYYPIKYDPERSTKAEADTVAESIRQALQGAYTRATTRRGHTKARADQVAGRPVRKDLGVVFEHIGQVTHDLAWHEWLIDANRLLRAKPIDAAVREHYGAEVLGAIRKGFDDIAAGEVPAIAITDRMLNHVRSGATIAGLGWNLTTALLQPIGLTQSIVRIGPRWVAQGMMRWAGDAVRLENSVKWVGERSEFMRLRAKTMQREINEIRNKVTGSDSMIEASFFYLIQKLQLVADMPTWLGMYEKQMAAGVDEKTAIVLADQAVLDAQGGGQIKDLAGVQRGGPLMKLWTNFYSFFNTTFNLTAESTARTNFKNPVSVALWATDMVLLYSIPALLGGLLKAVTRGGDDDEEELARKLLAEQLNYMLGTMVVVREANSAVQAALGQYGDYGGPAGVRLFGELARLGKQVQQGEPDEAFFKALNSTGGILFHYPAGQVQRTVLGARAFSEGDANVGALFFGPPAR